MKKTPKQLAEESSLFVSLLSNAKFKVGQPVLLDSWERIETILEVKADARDWPIPPHLVYVLFNSGGWSEDRLQAVTEHDIVIRHDVWVEQALKLLIAQCDREMALLYKYDIDKKKGPR